MNSKHLIVVGGGAAGFFCAINAARLNPKLKVTIVEKTNKLLSKVKVSGGGRCNVTHACFDITEMAKQYPRGSNFVKKSFHSFFTSDTIKWFEERNVSLKTEADGRMFPVTDSSQTIIDTLLRDANKYGVGVMMNAEVRHVKVNNSQFDLEFNEPRLMSPGDKHMTCDYLCIAAGGYPKSSLFDWIKTLGHSIEEPVPSLFTFNTPGHPITKLMGITVEQASVKIGESKLAEQGPLLITHWGLSGPVILRLSAWGARELKSKNWNFTAKVNWLPEFNEQSLRERINEFRRDQGGQKINSRNSFRLPQRLWEFLIEQSGIAPERRFADLPVKEQNNLVKNLTAFELEVKGKTTFKEEFVTAGGVKLSEVNAGSMESKINSRIYFAGEVLDVDGITGGFNFQFAWTSGWIVANSIANG